MVEPPELPGLVTSSPLDDGGRLGLTTLLEVPVGTLEALPPVVTPPPTAVPCTVPGLMIVPPAVLVSFHLSFPGRGCGLSGLLGLGGLI